MDELIYNAITGYYNALKKLGSYSYGSVYKILLLAFYRDFVYNDYRDKITSENYHEIEKALNCLFGTSCLIPYPDYLKMGKLHIGEITELSHRITILEEEEVLKLTQETTQEDSDVVVLQEETE